MGSTDLGCYDSKSYDTPHIDKLAAEGMRFTNAYAACPVCSPTRASIMTGKYPARLHLTDWIPGRKQWPTAKLLTPAFRQDLPLDEITLAEALEPAGYASASIGKWHRGGEGFSPTEQGFDRNVGGAARGSPVSYFGPFDLAAKYQTKLAGAKAQNNPVYAAMVESVDQGIGRLMAKLDELRIADRTVVILTADNGGLRCEGKSTPPVTSNAPLRAGKGHPYDGGIGEPLIVGWPGTVKAGSVFDRDYKLIEFYEDSRVEFYNLKDDIGERRNLARVESKMAAELRAKLARSRGSVGAEMPAGKADQGLPGVEPKTPEI